jgi:hypothetical protein
MPAPADIRRAGVRIFPDAGALPGAEPGFELTEV